MAELPARDRPSWTAAGVASPNPHWNRTGRTYLDPDGYRVVIATDDR